MADDVLTTPEINNFIEFYEVTKLDDIAKKRWFNKSAKTVKLYQTAALEASLECTERVKEAVQRYGKIEYFIKDLIILSIWKEKILPELLQVQPMPQHSVPTYIVLYTEIALIGLIQSLLFHSEMFLDIENDLIDLIDYCVHKLTTLNPDSVPVFAEIKLECDSFDDIKRHDKEIKLAVTANCVSLLRYICENLENLPVNVASRIYSTHDVPILIAHILDTGKWTKTTENGKLYKFCENNWREWFPKDPPLSQLEIQTWLLMRQLLLSPTCKIVYYFSNYRKEQLCKLIRHLYPNVIDQLSPLADLRYWLHSNSLNSDEGPRVHNPLIVDVTHQFSDNIYAEYEGKWKDIALARTKLLFYGDVKELQFLSKNFDDCLNNVLKMLDTIQTCFNCQAKANKRCSKCKNASYCSRKCQVEHWAAHKNVCK